MTKKPSPFAQQVYALAKQVPVGKVTTYKDIAQAMNNQAYRAIGQTLRCNPYAPQVPCHRVVASNGSLGGFRGHKKGQAIKDKIALLKSEGVATINNQIKNFSSIHHTFS